MKFSLRYSLHEAGWATAYLEHDQSVEMSVSYLNDTLKQFASSALELENGASRSQVNFLDEPGEHQLRLSRKAEILEYEIRWYDDWESWGLVSPEHHKTVIAGVVTLARYKHQVVSILHSISNEMTPEQYKDRWIEHDFPSHELKRLLAA